MYVFLLSLFVIKETFLFFVLRSTLTESICYFLSIKEDFRVAGRPFREELLPPLRSSHVILEEDSVIVIKGLDSLEEIKHAIGKVCVTFESCCFSALLHRLDYPWDQFPPQRLFGFGT